MFRLLLVLLVLVPCGAQELYSFIEHWVPGETVKYKEDMIWSFELPQGTTESGRTDTKTIKCLGYKDGFLLLEETMVNIIATKKTLGKMSADHDTNSLIGIPYTLYIDTLSGKTDHVETDYKEYEEMIRTLVMGMGEVESKIYPFGEIATNIKVGDSWSPPLDTIPIFMGEEEDASHSVIESKYKLDKVKSKKGVNIAYITASYEITCDLEFIQDSKVFEGIINGMMKDKIRFNLNENKTVLNKISGAMKFELTFEGEGFNAMLYINQKRKRVN